MIVEIGGLGLKVEVSAQTMRTVPESGARVHLHTRMIVRDDQPQLYGFAAEEERDLFMMLLGVGGIGPRVALSVLSSAPARELYRALACGDAAMFHAVPGVGKKTATRIILELGETVDPGVLSESGQPGRAGPRPDAEAGLVGLGYTPSEAAAMVANVSGESVEDLVSAALRAARSGNGVGLAGRR